MWTDGDMTLETVNTFLKENSIYTVDPLTGEPYTQGMSFRLKLLCLPTLYGTISRWSGMAPETVVYRLIPCLTLCMGYLAYGRLGAVLLSIIEKMQYLPDHSGNTVLCRSVHARRGRL